MAGFHFGGGFRRSQGGGGLPYTPPLDAANAAGAWSIRKLRTDYFGFCMNVRRSSDDTFIDVGFDSNGYLDTAEILSFVGGGNGTVRIFYDQTGNGYNFEATSSGNEPRIVNSGVLQLENGLAALSFNGSNQWLFAGTNSDFNFLHNGSNSNIFFVTRTGNSANPNSLYALLATMAPSSSNIGGVFGFDDRSVASANNGLYCIIGNGSSGNQPVLATQNNVWTPNTQILGYFSIDADNAVAADRLAWSENNEIEATPNTSANAPSVANSQSALRLGEATGGFRYLGTMQEIIIYDTDQSDNKATLQTNLIDYFNIPI